MYLNEFFRAPAWACRREQQIGAFQTALRERHRSVVLVHILTPCVHPWCNHTVHFVTGHTPQQPEASPIPSVYQGRSPTSRSSNPQTDSTRPSRPPVHLSRIECHPPAIGPAVEPLLSGVEQVTVNPQPYFVPSTASALEILINVAIQDLSARGAESYDLPCQPTNSPTPTSVSDSRDSFEFDFVNPFARDDYSDSDWEAGEEETTDDTVQSPSKPIDSPNQFRGLDLLSLVHINREIQLISSSVVEVTLRNTRADALPREDHGDGEEAIIIPVTPFPHPHLLSPIIEEHEDDGSSGPEMDSEDEDETSDTETIRPSTRILARPRLSVNTGIDWGVWRCKTRQCPMSLTVQLARSK